MGGGEWMTLDSYQAFEHEQKEPRGKFSKRASCHNFLIRLSDSNQTSSS